jgi:energy-coupling factor transporter ATP-binding protein EcfA2
MSINALDPSQKHALSSIASSNSTSDLFLIYGPPGTGKSQLLVSLLFELATRGKKVLFVSQNTEALDVIDRMITNLDKNFKLPENHLSLKDFCLKLYSKDQRYLKYLRGQSARLSSKVKPFYDSSSSPNASSRPYDLAYINLERHANDSPKGEIGIDELLRFYLKYVDEDLVVETIKGFEDIDVREILKCIEGYNLIDDFAYYNNPQNELRYISKTNPSVNLNDIQSRIDEMEQLLQKLPTAQPKTTIKQDLEAYLHNLKSVSNLSSQLNLVKIQSDNLDLAELERHIEEVIACKPSLLNDSEIISGVENLQKTILNNKNQIKYVEDSVS